MSGTHFNIDPKVDGAEFMLDLGKERRNKLGAKRRNAANGKAWVIHRNEHPAMHFGVEWMIWSTDRKGDAE